VVNAGAGDVASHDPTVPMTPASTQKLLTSLAALSTMGPDFKYETKAVAASEPANGTVERLWLVGAGDPSLSTPDYPGMVESNPARNREEQATAPASPSRRSQRWLTRSSPPAYATSLVASRETTHATRRCGTCPRGARPTGRTRRWARSVRSP
jgi:D-alanyl-D-alanine carboxypeptidase